MIRQARPGDAADLLAIYRPLVEQTTVSFELATPSVDEFAGRIAAALETHEWLVVETASGLGGYAYATPHRPREAYRYAVETSVYVHPNQRRNGFGRQLYAALFAALAQRDFHNAYAGIALPNAGSIALHRQVGFEPVGVFREIGFKFGAWHDVSWWQRALRT